VELVIASSSSQLVVGSSEVAELEIEALDRFDNDASIAGVTVTVDDRPVPALIDVDNGIARVRLSAPRTWPGRERVLVLAHLGGLVARKEILLKGGTPTRVIISGKASRLEADGHASLDLVAEVFDRRGTPTTTSHIVWTTVDEGTLQALPSPRFATYAARFTPSPGLRDREAQIVVTVEPGVTSATLIAVETPRTRSATARVGIISDLHGVFGQTALVEVALPASRQAGFGRLLSVGLSAGYIHSDLTVSGPAPSTLHADFNQFPLLGLVRVRLPMHRPVEVSLTALVGGTWVSSAVSDQLNGAVVSRGAAAGAAGGGGVDLALPLRPGELIVGTRYLLVSARRLSNGDALSGNLGGLIFDVGFRLRH
jgi:hypothetical protein